MQRTPMEMTAANMASASSTSARRVSAAIALAAEIQADSKQVARLIAQRCKACFYFPAVAGAAMTTRDCGLCAKPEMYGSTSASALCMPCANANRLCRHCGGDLDMNASRRTWPAGYSEASVASHKGAS
jgi:hypothetical protein